MKLGSVILPATVLLSMFGARAAHAEWRQETIYAEGYEKRDTFYQWCSGPTARFGATSLWGGGSVKIWLENDAGQRVCEETGLSFVSWRRVDREMTCDLPEGNYRMLIESQGFYDEGAVWNPPGVWGNYYFGC